ncbi:ABC transporter permease [Lagierella sp.]|uniref:ABC transporter permease n=1 Tax=Lagierella sp. TaxID=2849657 RepID=UPI002602EE43|nr:ABC transporter permease [Lagierella sp.]
MKKVYISILAILMLFIWVGPIFHPVDPAKTDLGSIQRPPESDHLLGTDGLGRDILVRLMHGGRKSVVISFTSTVLKMLLSLTLAFLASGSKRIENFIMRIVDVFMCFPFYVLALCIAAFIGSNVRNLILVIVVFTFAPATRLLVNEIKVIKDMEFIQLLKVNGIKSSVILFKHIIPNIRDTLLVIFTSSMAQAILMEASLSFLGFGIKEPQTSLGTILAVALNILNVKDKWWMWLPAGVLVVLLVFSIQGLGEEYAGS